MSGHYDDENINGLTGVESKRQKREVFLRRFFMASEMLSGVCSLPPRSTIAMKKDITTRCPAKNSDMHFKK